MVKRYRLQAFDFVVEIIHIAVYVRWFIFSSRGGASAASRDICRDGQFTVINFRFTPFHGFYEINFA